MKKTIFKGDSLGSPGIIYSSADKAGVFLGIHFGFSVIPEHERGLEGIWKELGVPHKLIPENFGLKMYTTTQFPQNRLFFEKGKTHTCLTFESGVGSLKGWQNEELDNNPDSMATAWDDNSFGVVVSNQYSDALLQLYKAFERKDVMVQFRLDTTYVSYPHPYLWIGILSHVKSGEEEQVLKIHKELYEKQSKKILEA
jgi:hypothetical protein